jgi:hypothetical protein
MIQNFPTDIRLGRYFLGDSFMFSGGYHFFLVPEEPFFVPEDPLFFPGLLSGAAGGTVPEGLGVFGFSGTLDDPFPEDGVAAP